MNCISCGKTAELPIRALQLRTMHVRGMEGEEKYQVPDDAVTEYSVCRECAEKELARLLSGGTIRKRLLIFGLVLVLGIPLALLFRGRERVFFVTGIAAVFAGAAGLVSTLRDWNEERRRLSALPKEEALYEAAWQVFLAHAPSQMQDGRWKLTYLPVNEKTYATKPGDLMVLYDIQAGVAKEVMTKIGHPQA